MSARTHRIEALRASWRREAAWLAGMPTLAVIPLLAFGLAAAHAQEREEPLNSRPAIRLTSPLDYQVFQRRTRLAGAILIAGDGPEDTVRAQARFRGDSPDGPVDSGWTPITMEAASGRFQAMVRAPAGGFYRVEVRAILSSGVVATQIVQHVGVGEVFVVSGQSNSTNYGEVRQRTATGMVASFDGSIWGVANDPQPGVQDASTKGSFIPAFGDALYRRYRVPIGIASVGHGSTSVRQWLPAGTPIKMMPTMTRFVKRPPDGTLVSDGTLFDGMMQRIRQLGPHGFRALLWHQGESDSHQPAGHDIDAATYAGMMQVLIGATRREAGWDFPWFVAEATYHTPDDASCEPIREAQRSLWRDGLALEGPDTDTLTAEYRQNGGKGTHFNDAGLKAHGRMWADRVVKYLDTVLQ